MEIYLDHNASAVPEPGAARAAAEWLLGLGGNASSVHARGRRARGAVERARRQLAAALGVLPGDLVFTSGATEALHLAVLGSITRGDHVVASAVEHPALFGACAAAGAEVTRVPVDALGSLSTQSVLSAIRPNTRLVAIMAAQNEIGNLYPVRDIAQAVAPIPILCDAVQAFGKVPLRLPELGAALAVISGHKIGAPQGVGALHLAPGTALRPVIAGGAQERGRRAGTENVAGIVGLGEAAAAVPARLARMEAVRGLRDRLWAGLRARVPGLLVHGDPAAGLPNTLSFRFEEVDGDVLLAALDLEGICLSSGSACSSGAIEPSPVLRALGLDEAAARGGLRASLGPENTTAEIDRVLDVLPPLVHRAREAGLRRCA